MSVEKFIVGLDSEQGQTLTTDLLDEHHLEIYFDFVSRLIRFINNLLMEVKIEISSGVIDMLSPFVDKIIIEVKNLLEKNNKVEGDMEENGEIQEEPLTYNLRDILYRVENLSMILGECFNTFPDFWVRPYLRLLDSIVFTYVDFHEMLTKKEKRKVNEYFKKIMEINLRYPKVRFSIEDMNRNIFSSLINYMNSLFDSGDVERAIQFGYEMLNYVKSYANLVGNRYYHALLLTNLAGILIVKKVNYDDAKNFLFEAESIIYELYKTDKETFISDYAFVLLQLSNYYSFKGSKDEAFFYANLSLDIFKENKKIRCFLEDSLKNTTRSLIAQLLKVHSLFDQNDLDLIIQFLQTITNTAHIYKNFSEIEKAIDLLKSIEEQTKFFYKCLTSRFFSIYFTIESLLGDFYLLSEKYTEAEHHFRQSLDIYFLNIKKFPINYSTGSIRNFINLGTAYYLKQDYEKALSSYREAEKLIKKYYHEILEEDEQLIQHCYFNLGITYIKLGEINSAISSLNTAYNIADRMYRENENNFEVLKEYIKVKNALAFAYELNGEYSFSKNLYKKLGFLGEIVYMKDPEFWKDNFITDLLKYAYHLSRDGELTEALTILEKAYRYVTSFYNEDNEYWIHTYFSIIKHLAELYEYFGELDKKEYFEQIETKLLTEYPDIDLLDGYFPIVNFSEEVYREKLHKSISE